MSDMQKPSSETLARAARELVGTRLDERELEAVAGLVGALVTEMAPMRAMETLDVEPATLYDAREPER
jgi:hypothetical protein